MSKQRKQSPLLLVVFISAIIFMAVIIWVMVKQQETKHTPTEHRPEEQSLFEPFAKSTAEGNYPKISLNDVINAASGWGPIFTSWYGQTAPDFRLIDINGKQHRLSDYRGRDVLIIFWATWCGPCLMEIPHLIELRETTGEDKLAMLAISYETIFPPNTAKMVKSSAEKQKLNYTVFSVDKDDMPEPYSQIQGIPSSFFINPEGKIKLATSGLLTLGAIRAILAAQ